MTKSSLPRTVLSGIEGLVLGPRFGLWNQELTYSFTRCNIELKFSNI